MISVIVKTHNGAKSLPQTFAALSAQQPPQDGWELIVVDNASTDGTAELAASWSQRLPLICVHEPCKGRGHAINRGIAHGPRRSVHPH